MQKPSKSVSQQREKRRWQRWQQPTRAGGSYIQGGPKKVSHYQMIKKSY